LSSLDFGHLTFVQRGISSTSPLSAGMFHDGEGESFVSVKLLDKLPKTETKELMLELDLPDQSQAGKVVEGYLVITNPNMFASLNVLPSLESHPVRMSSSPDVIGILPPLSTTRIPFELAASYNLQTVENTVRASYKDQIVEQNIVIANWKELVKPYLIGLSVGAFALLLLWYFIKAKIWKKQ